MTELEYTEQGWRYTTDTARHHRHSGGSRTLIRKAIGKKTFKKVL